MSSLANPTWRKPTVYIGRPKLEHPHHQVFNVIGNPFPIYWAEVRQDGGTGQWVITWHTGAWANKERFVLPQEALKRAYGVIGETTARDWHERFSGDQRTAMGQQRCPYSYGADMLCQRTIVAGTVWCHRHPWGKAVGT